MPNGRRCASVSLTEHEARGYLMLREPLEKPNWFGCVVPAKNDHLPPRGLATAAADRVLDIHCLRVKTIEHTSNVRIVVKANRARQRSIVSAKPCASLGNRRAAPGTDT